MIVVGIVTVSVVALFAADLYRRHLAAIENAERSASKLADVLAEQTGHTFETLDLTLGAAELVRANTAAGLYPAAMANRALRLLWRSAPFILAIESTNAAGDVLSHSYEGNPEQWNIAAQPYFEAQRAAKDGRFLISRPFRSDSTNQWVFSVSRRLTDADGGFAGIVSAIVDPSYFAPVYRVIKPGDNGSVVLMLRDGSTLTREPFTDSAMTSSFGNDAAFQKRVTAMDAGAFETTSPIDEIARIVAFKSVSNFPLVMLVTYSRKEALGPMYAHIREVAPLVAALVVMIVLGGALLSRRSVALAGQTALLQATLENMEQGLIVVDGNGAVPVCNRRAMDLLGLPATLMASNPTAEDLIAFQTGQGEYVEVSEDVKKRLMPQIFGEERYVFERKRPNGTILEIQTVPFADGGVVRTFTDVTARRAAEAALKHSETQYRLLADNSTDMVFRLDLDLVRRYVSPASLEILGYPPEQLTGQKPVNMIHPDDAQRVEDVYRAVLNGQERGSVTNRIRHRDGHWVWVEAELRLVRDQDSGQPSGILGALRDVSSRKAAEAETVAARKLAEQAAAAQGEFLATMSHELRTPLNSVLGFADILLDRADLIPEVRRQIGLIQTSGAYLLTVVNDVLDFSKIEEGKLDLVSTDFSLLGLIDNSISVVRDSANKKHLKITVQIDKTVPAFVSGDENRLRQVLLNLLNNAIKFTQTGHVALSVAHIGSQEAGEQVRFAVSDTGIGIAPDNLHRLFQRFSQVDGSTSREYGGSGLGLAICKRLIELMGGQIGVESNPGEGSTFWFTLTFSATAAPEAARLPDRTQAAGNMRPVRILVVEDMEVNQEIVRSMLEASGHDVDVVSDGSDAVLAVQARSYDVVLMDIQMAGMDGVTATKCIRGLAGPAGLVPIIAMTANVLPQQIESFRAAGMNGHVGKPLGRQDLLAAIERGVARVSAAAPALPALQSHSGPILDAEIFATISGLIGHAKVSDLLGKLKARLAMPFSADPETAEQRGEIAREAHKLISTAGMFGFMKLSESCARLEIAAEDDQAGVAALLDDAREACRSALAEITLLLGGPKDVAKKA